MLDNYLTNNRNKDKNQLFNLLDESPKNLFFKDEEETITLDILPELIEKIEGENKKK